MKLCECGCGKPTTIVARSDLVAGRIKGQPNRYLRGHNPKGTLPTLEARFWQKVDRGRLQDCWLWLGSIDKCGYGRFWVGDRLDGAHRFAWELFIGPIPEGYELDHLCRVTHCVNPAHLEPVTHRENMGRGVKASQTHCIHGHEFTPANTVRRPNGTRACRACANARRRMGCGEDDEHIDPNKHFAAKEEKA